MHVLKVINKTDGKVVVHSDYHTRAELDSWVTQSEAKGVWGSPEYYTLEITDNTAQEQEEKLRREIKVADRFSRVDLFKKIDWSTIDTIAELRAIVRVLVKEAIKDDE